MAVPCKGDGHFHLPPTSKRPRQATLTGISSSCEQASPTIGPGSSDLLHLERGQITRTLKLLLIAASVLATVFAVPAHAQPGYGQQRITCSSNDDRRNWCAIGNSRDVQLVRQISGSPCVRGQTWGVDNRGLWVDQGCRADFAIVAGYGPPPGPPPPTIITCSSNNGKRNWCDTGGRRDIHLNRQISGSACIQGQTWGVRQPRPLGRQRLPRRVPRPLVHTLKQKSHLQTGWLFSL
jgi:Protein of unknown function (DUF3011)